MSVPPTRWLARLLGRRGAVLAVLGIAFVFNGLGGLATGQPPKPEHMLLFTYIPTIPSALLWIIPGLAALVAAAQRGTGRDGFGFAALVVPLGLRAFSFIWSTVSYFAGASDWPFAWTGALTWIALLAMILIIAGWPEEPDLPRPRRRTRKGGDVAH